jgi:hypothetical protein
MKYNIGQVFKVGSGGILATEMKIINYAFIQDQIVYKLKPLDPTYPFSKVCFEQELDNFTQVIIDETSNHANCS